jgi:hypothetical protein
VKNKILIKQRKGNKNLINNRNKSLKKPNPHHSQKKGENPPK